MNHEDGHCDLCGCVLTTAWLTFDGLELCAECATSDTVRINHGASRPEARDDGR